MRVLIMAQGSQSRLRATLGDLPKQLIPVNGEPMMARTLRLLNGCDDGPGHIQIVRPPGLGAWGEFELKVNGPTFRSLSLPGLCVVDGLRQCLPIGRSHERIVVLLGDVCWSRETLYRLLADVRPMVFCGWSPVTTSVGEIYGVSLSASVLGLITDHCASHVKACRAVGYEVAQPGHLRQVLWSVTAEAYRHPDAWLRCAPSCWLEADTLTMDVDTPADLEELRRLEPALARRK